MQESKLIENIGSQSGPIGKIKSLKKTTIYMFPLTTFHLAKWPMNQIVGITFIHSIANPNNNHLNEVKWEISARNCQTRLCRNLNNDLIWLNRVFFRNITRQTLLTQLWFIETAFKIGIIILARAKWGQHILFISRIIYSMVHGTWQVSIVIC